jgi:hypothetical protein
MRVKLSRRTLKRLLRITVLVVGFVGISIGLYHLGRRVTPLSHGEPVIYSPSVRRTETYRRQIKTWVADARAVDACIVALLTEDQTNANVYRLSDGAQECLEEAVRLAQAISLKLPPVSLLNLQEGVQATADLYLEAALHLNSWVGEPTEERYLLTLEAVRVARAARVTVENNPWLEERAPASEHVPGDSTEAPVELPIDEGPAPRSPWGE